MRLLASLALPLIAFAVTADAQPGRQRDQQQVWDARRSGRLLPLREIEGRVVPQMRGSQYLGSPEIDGAIYTLKFLRNGVVIWVEVDGRSGEIVGRTGE